MRRKDMISDELNNGDISPTKELILIKNALEQTKLIKFASIPL